MSLSCILLDSEGWGTDVAGCDANLDVSLVASQVGALNPVPTLYLLFETLASVDQTRVPTLYLLFEIVALVDLRFFALTVTPLSSLVGLLLSCPCSLSCFRFE